MPKLKLSPRFLDPLNSDYIKSQLETGHPTRTKKALQDLCRLYRVGYRIRPPQLIAIEQSIVGLLYTQRKDEKVRRWALNALARLGREPECMEAIIQVLETYKDEPQTTASAIAAIYRMSRKASEILRKLSFDEQMVALAALQHVDAHKLDLSSLPLNVETASPDLLKLALVVVGLDRAPVNLLNPRHDNAQMVKALGGHHDIIVSQYSVWAITENDSLGLEDMGIDIRTIEQQPPNVRSWIFRLVAMTPKDAQKHFEYLELGMRDPEVEARVGLARGLKDTFFDGLEPLILDWFTTEADADVSQHLLDHMIRQAHQCPQYEAMAVEVYEKESPGSAMRRRMEAEAAGRSLYGKLKQIDVDGSRDLFRGAAGVTNNTFNIKGGVQGGAVSFGGNAENSAPTTVNYTLQTIDIVKSELSKAERELYASSIDEGLKKEALEHVQAAKGDPSPDKITKAITALGKVEALAGKALGAGTAIANVVTTIGKVTGLL